MICPDCGTKMDYYPQRDNTNYFICECCGIHLTQRGTKKKIYDVTREGLFLVERTC